MFAFKSEAQLLAWSLVRVCIALLSSQSVMAEVVRVDVQRQDDFGTHERIIGRVHFAVDPQIRANQRITDVEVAPRNNRGRVEFSSDLLLFVPKDSARARRTVFVEVVNRGSDQSLTIMSGAKQPSYAPEAWSLGDRFLLEEGFTVAFLGWQFDVKPADGLTFDAPIAPVRGVVREAYVETNPGQRVTSFALTYCASDVESARLTFRKRIKDPPRPLPRNEWQLATDRCSVVVRTGFRIGIYEAAYGASGSPVTGLGLAAIRDFASFLKYENQPIGGVVRADDRAIGYGYSQSGRFLREFVRDGFNIDERGRQVFDGLMIAAAGAGVGSFNHRFASPGESGNSMLSILRPVDIPPFTDAGLLEVATRDKVTPKIMYTYSSTEYWARGGSLTHTTPDGRHDVPLAPTSRLYFLASTAHSSDDFCGPVPSGRTGRPKDLEHFVNFAQQRWVSRALLMDLELWVRSGVEPPPSKYPTVGLGDLVSRGQVRFPAGETIRFPEYMPGIWRVNFGDRFDRTGVITREPPELGNAYRILVPQVDGDGNDRGGIRLPEIVVPMGTYTGWNITVPQLRVMSFLAGLTGSFEPFTRTRAEREVRSDHRLSVEERYSSREDYLQRVGRAIDALVQERLVLPQDRAAALERALEIWSAFTSQ